MSTFSKPESENKHGQIEHGRKACGACKRDRARQPNSHEERKSSRENAPRGASEDTSNRSSRGVDGKPGLRFSCVVAEVRSGLRLTRKRVPPANSTILLAASIPIRSGSRAGSASGMRRVPTIAMPNARMNAPRVLNRALSIPAGRPRTATVMAPREVRPPWLPCRSPGAGERDSR